MSELTPEKAREYEHLHKLAIKEDWGFKEMSDRTFGYLERDAQLRPLIEGLVEKLEWIKKRMDHKPISDAYKLAEEALTPAHKAGFGKKEA